MISKILVLSWQFVIFMFSAQPAVESKSLSSGMTAAVVSFIFPNMSADQVADVAEKLSFVVRKGAHFTIYLVLGVLMYNCIRRVIKITKPVLMSFVFCALYAVTDEIHQIFVDGRAGRIMDVCIDSAGSLFGIVLIWLSYKLYQKKADKV